jgi:hypothetical protein
MHSTSLSTFNLRRLCPRLTLFPHLPLAAGVAGFKHREKKPALFVDLLACSLLLGWVETVLITAIAPLNEKVLSAEMKLQVLVAVNKIL